MKVERKSSSGTKATFSSEGDKHPVSIPGKGLEKGIFSRRRAVNSEACCPAKQFILKQVERYDPNDVPISLKVRPDDLLHLVEQKIDKLPLEKVSKWTTDDVVGWITRLGYPSYKTSFRINKITGKNLILLDASGLSAMNCRKFVDIQHITRSICRLYGFRRPSYRRNLSLPSVNVFDQYKLYRTRNGIKYSEMRRSHFWTSFNFIRPNKTETQWDILERWVRMQGFREFPEKFAGSQKKRLYACKKIPRKEEQTFAPIIQPKNCECIPPCDCYASPTQYKKPSVLRVLRKSRQPPSGAMSCKNCIPPCECEWKASQYKTPRLLKCLVGTLKLTKPK